MSKIKRRMLSPSWFDLLEAFVEARAAYEPVHRTYEDRVKRLAREHGVDRKKLRLDWGEVSNLLDFARLETLRNGWCHDLKEIAHALFRKKSSTDKLDRYASEIYHELSILKEEQYKVSTFAPEYQKRKEIDEYESILDEVHEEFPRKVHNIHDIFERARRRLEAVLRRHAHDAVLVRSLALFGPALLEKAKDRYPRGLVDLYWLMYPNGPAEGHLVAGERFAASGFKENALAALRAAVATGESPPPEERKDAVQSAELLALIERARSLEARLAPLSAVEVVAESRRAIAERALTSEPPADPDPEEDAPAHPSGEDIIDHGEFTPPGGTPVPALGDEGGGGGP